MNPYTFPTTCSVCGGPGVMHMGEIGMDWLQAYSHRDPEVCASYLRQEQRKIETLKKEQETKGQP